MATKTLTVNTDNVSNALKLVAALQEAQRHLANYVYELIYVEDQKHTTTGTTTVPDIPFTDLLTQAAAVGPYPLKDSAFAAGYPGLTTFDGARKRSANKRKSALKALAALQHKKKSTKNKVKRSGR